MIINCDHLTKRLPFIKLALLKISYTKTPKIALSSILGPKLRQKDYFPYAWPSINFDQPVATIQ